MRFLFSADSNFHARLSSTASTLQNKPYGEAVADDSILRVIWSLGSRFTMLKLERLQ